MSNDKTYEAWEAIAPTWEEIAEAFALEEVGEDA